MKIKELDIQIEVITHNEDINPQDHIEDQESINTINKRLELGDIWAWTCVEIKGVYKNILSASDYLGACSYKSEDDFIKGAYYQDMVNNCIDQLNEQAKALN